MSLFSGLQTSIILVWQLNKVIMSIIIINILFYFAIIVEQYIVQPRCHLYFVYELPGIYMYLNLITTLVTW